MHLDVQDLRNFYYRSALGRAAQKTLRQELLKFWPEAKGQTVAGFGFAVPFLRPYLSEARRGFDGGGQQTGAGADRDRGQGRGAQPARSAATEAQGKADLTRKMACRYSVGRTTVSRLCRKLAFRRGLRPGITPEDYFPR